MPHSISRFIAGSTVSSDFAAHAPFDASAPLGAIDEKRFRYESLYTICFILAWAIVSPCWAIRGRVVFIPAYSAWAKLRWCSIRFKCSHHASLLGFLSPLIQSACP